jgi:uroporphyrinogen decarboxylase
MSAPDSIFVRACKSQPVERTPVWFMRQAGRYMPEYRAVRKQYSLLEICKKPALAAEVTITAAEALGVDSAIIFADLLLPLEVMGLPFHFSAGEGPVIEKPVRTSEDIALLRTDRAADLGYVAEAVSLVAKHFAGRIPVIGFCGAPFTLASYMIEGGGSRNYVHAKKMMYNAPADWNVLMGKLVTVAAAYSAAQVRAGADVIQIFDSWVGCLSAEDYRRYVLPHVTSLVKTLQATGAPIIYFGTDSATLLPAMRETGAEVIGLDWRIPLDEGWRTLGHSCGVQGNLDPVLLFADWKEPKIFSAEPRDAPATSSIWATAFSRKLQSRTSKIWLASCRSNRLPASARRLPEAESRKPEAAIHETHRHRRRRHFRTLRRLLARRTHPRRRCRGICPL